MRAKWLVVVAVAACAAAGCSRQEAGWRDAAREDTVAAYESYLAKYPVGPRADDARRRIEALRDDGEWARASRLRTPEAWQRYLSDRPDGRHATEARERLMAWVPGPAARGHWAVQLGAWSAAAAAHAGLARLRAAHPEALQGVALVVLAPRESQDGVWRVRTGPLAEAGARALCTMLRERGVDCVPVAD